MSAVAESFWETLPLGRGVTLIVHDMNGLAAFAKPAGILSHPNAGGEERRSLLTVRYALEGEFYQWTPAKGEPPVRLWLLNRLDSATSGVVLAAADEEVARTIRAQFKQKQVRKVYYALVFGAPRQATELWKDTVAVVKKSGQVRAAASSGRVPAESKMTVVKTSRGEPKLSLLRLEPHTGRSHQLRVQCAKRHLPIVGDQTYGNFARNREFAKATGVKRMFLHSLETSFDYEINGRRHTFAARAPLPAEFAVL